MNYRRSLMTFFTVLGSIYFLFEFLLPKTVLVQIGIEPYNEEISNGFIAVGTMAFGLGLWNVIEGHGRRILFLRHGWGNSFALLIGLFLMLGLSAFDWKSDATIENTVEQPTMLASFAKKIVEDKKSKVVTPIPFRERVLLLRDSSQQFINEEQNIGVPQKQLEEVVAKIASFPGKDGEEEQLVTWSAQLGDSLSQYSVIRLTELRKIKDDALSAKLFKLLTDGLFTALGSAMFSLLGVYIAAAAFRAFRVKSIDALLMMAAAVLVILGQTSFGKSLWTGFPGIRSWLLEVPNSAAFRAIRIGALVAGLVMSFRILLGWDSSSISGENAS